jgi:hypothetical protein
VELAIGVVGVVGAFIVGVAFVEKQASGRFVVPGGFFVACCRGSGFTALVFVGTEFYELALDVVEFVGGVGKIAPFAGDLAIGVIAGVAGSFYGIGGIEGLDLGGLTEGVDGESCFGASLGSVLAR